MKGGVRDGRLTGETTMPFSNIYRLPTRLRFLWNELNFFVRKYLGRIVSANWSTSRIRNALPLSDHEITNVSLGDSLANFASLSSISYRRLGNCWGTPRFPVRGYAKEEIVVGESVTVMMEVYKLLKQRRRKGGSFWCIVIQFIMAMRQQPKDVISVATTKVVLCCW